MIQIQAAGLATDSLFSCGTASLPPFFAGRACDKFHVVAWLSAALTSARHWASVGASKTRLILRLWNPDFTSFLFLINALIVKCQQTLGWQYYFLGSIGISPHWKPEVNIIFIRKYRCSWRNNRLDEWLYRYLFDILKHSNENLSGALNHPEYRRFFFFKSSSPSCAPQTIAPA